MDTLLLHFCWQLLSTMVIPTAHSSLCYLPHPGLKALSHSSCHCTFYLWKDLKRLPRHVRKVLQNTGIHVHENVCILHALWFDVGARQGVQISAHVCVHALPPLGMCGESYAVLLVPLFGQPEEKGNTCSFFFPPDFSETGLPFCVSVYNVFSTRCLQLN